MNTIIVIPARYGSSRYRGKPLAKILGREMVLRVADICKKIVGIKNLYIATDSKLIENVALREGYKTIITSKKCLTGTDRVAEVSKKISAKTYINVQGDEPIFNPTDLRILLKEIKKYPNEIITGYCEIDNSLAHKDPNIPKVVVRPDGRLLYASRAPIPSSKVLKFVKGWRQVCVYAFPRKTLKIFSSVKKKTELEKIEDIEYLRFLELGLEVRAVKMSKNSMAVDTPHDVKLVKKKIAKLGLK